MNSVATIAAAAAEHGLRFVIAGGHAVIAHGYHRSTFDLDLVICRAETERWMELATGLGYTLRHQGPTFLQFDAPAFQWLPLDIMLVEESTFLKLHAEASSAETPATGPVVSLKHLLALKCHAVKHGHPGRIVKDADDVIRLVQANSVHLNDPAIRELFLRHGTEEFYEKVRKATQ